jgi:monofunctional biosynthetic peptidoglycan transglycosylase
VLVAEDQRFLQHAGFDTKAIGNAVGELAAGGRLRGASTISQQVAKNLFLWPGRSVLRKAAEAWLTIWIELLWPKRRIAEVYVNVAQFGPCVFGAEAASRLYFGRRAADLTALQAARLAAVLPAPGRMRVDDPGPFAEERAREIEAEMRRGGGPAYLRGL